MVAWAGVERLRLGLAAPPPATAEPQEGEWIDLRPRWPLTSEKHPRCPSMVVPKTRRLAKPSKQPHTSLTDVTRAALQPAAADTAVAAAVS
jgi:hypothetical protein